MRTFANEQSIDAPGGNSTPVRFVCAGADGESASHH